MKSDYAHRAWVHPDEADEGLALYWGALVAGLADAAVFLAVAVVVFLLI